MTDLLTNLIKNGALVTPRIIAAFRAVDRADFVLPEYRDRAHDDIALPIGFGQTISQPYTVATMLELLQPQRGDFILDIGSGSGWTTALLAHIVGKKGRVVGLELIPELTSFGQANLAKQSYPNARILQADPQALGLTNTLATQAELPPEKKLFDKVLVSASALELPQDLLEQVKVGGALVLPVDQSIIRVEKNAPEKNTPLEKNIVKKTSTKKELPQAAIQKELPGFSFVPLIVPHGLRDPKSSPRH